MFQICNLQNHIYNASEGVQRYVNGKIAVLDYDDLIIEIVDSVVVTDSIISQLTATEVRHVNSPTGRKVLTTFLPRCDTSPPNSFLEWSLDKRVLTLKLKPRGIKHSIGLLRQDCMSQTIDNLKHGVLQYDNIKLLEYTYEDEIGAFAELHVNYAFRYGNYLIMRLTVEAVVAMSIRIPLLRPSLVFLGNKLLGCYVTYTAHSYKIYNPLSPELESKLLFFLKDKY